MGDAKQRILDPSTTQPIASHATLLAKPTFTDEPSVPSDPSALERKLTMTGCVHGRPALGGQLHASRPLVCETLRWRVIVRV